MSADDAGLRVHLSEAIAATDPTLRGRLRTDPDAYLDLVVLTARARAETDALLRLAVAGARAAGSTWESIGGALGMSKQAAQQRYGGATDEDGAGPASAAGSDGDAGDDGAPTTADARSQTPVVRPDDGDAPTAGPVVDPEDPDARVHQITWLNSFTEMKALENAGRYGWHLVGVGSGTVIVRKSDVQWEHQRVFASRSAGRALEQQGWLRCGTASFPHAYYKRATDRPALPEPHDDGYLGRL